MTETEMTETEMANFRSLDDATLRLDEAERAVRIAELRIQSAVRGLPLRFQVEDSRRLRVATEELEAARVAYDVAQDLPAPEF